MGGASWRGQWPPSLALPLLGLACSSRQTSSSFLCLPRVPPPRPPRLPSQTLSFLQPHFPWWSGSFPVSWGFCVHRWLCVESLPAGLLKTLPPLPQALSSNALSSGSELAMTPQRHRLPASLPEPHHHLPRNVVVVVHTSASHRPSVR